MRTKNYIGLDVHQTNSYFVILGADGKVRQRMSVATTERDLLEVVRSIRGSKALALEETSLSQWVYLLLREEVAELVICNPAKLGKKHGPKTDFRDAAELAQLLRLNGLQAVYHGSADDDERMELRILVSGYGDVVQELVRAKNRLKALFGLTAQMPSGGKLYTDVKALEKLGSDVKAFVAHPLFAQIQMLEQQKAMYHKRFESNLKRFSEMRWIASIPGFGAVRANQVAAIVVTPYRFSTKYKFFSYARLVRHRLISNGKVCGTRRAEGNNTLKSVFKMAAWNTLIGDNAFHRKYDRMIRHGSTPKAAHCAIARALAATVLGVWKNGKKYQDHVLEVNERRAKPKAA